MAEANNSLTQEQVSAMFEIWQAAFPTNVLFDSIVDFQDFLNRLVSPTFLFESDAGDIVAFLAYFTREDNTWFIMAVSPGKQKTGIGSKLLQQAKALNKQLYGWVALDFKYKLQNHGAYLPPIDFYVKQGFTPNHNVRFGGKGLETIRIEWQSNP